MTPFLDKYTYKIVHTFSKNSMKSGHEMRHYMSPGVVGKS